MLIIPHFKVIFNPKTKVFHIVSEQTSSCPFCGGDLEVRDSKRRGVIDGAGVKKVFSLRRLECVDCHKLHIEMPSFIQPYKRYASDVIEAVLDDRSEECPAEVSTIRRWRQWFIRISPYIERTLAAIKLTDFSESVNLLNYSTIIGHIRSSGVGWLSRLMQMLVNCGSRLAAAT